MDDSGVRRCRITRGTIGEPFMAKADAWHATGGSFHARRTAVKRASAGLMGNARMIAEPAYRKLLAAEPFLRRLIPILIVVFLVVVAATRFLSLMNDRDDIERAAKGVLSLASGQLSHAAPTASRPAAASEGVQADAWNAVIDDILATGALGRGHVLLVADGDLVVRAATASAASRIGQPL